MATNDTKSITAAGRQERQQNLAGIFGSLGQRGLMQITSLAIMRHTRYSAVFPHAHDSLPEVAGSFIRKFGVYEPC